MSCRRRRSGSGTATGEAAEPALLWSGLLTLPPPAGGQREGQQQVCAGSPIARATCRYEVGSGLLVAPGVPGIAERQDMQKLIGTYGKAWHMWQVDLGDPLPYGAPGWHDGGGKQGASSALHAPRMSCLWLLQPEREWWACRCCCATPAAAAGPPQLMMAFTDDNQVRPELVEERDRRYGMSTAGEAAHCAQQPHSGAPAQTQAQAPPLPPAGRCRRQGPRAAGAAGVARRRGPRRRPLAEWHGLADQHGAGALQARPWRQHHPPPQGRPQQPRAVIYEACDMRRVWVQQQPRFTCIAGTTAPFPAASLRRCSAPWRGGRRAWRRCAP